MKNKFQINSQNFDIAHNYLMRHYKFHPRQKELEELTSIHGLDRWASMILDKDEYTRLRSAIRQSQKRAKDKADTLSASA